MPVALLASITCNLGISSPILEIYTKLHDAISEDRITLSKNISGLFCLNMSFTLKSSFSNSLNTNLSARLSTAFVHQPKTDLY